MGANCTACTDDAGRGGALDQGGVSGANAGETASSGVAGVSGAPGEAGQGTGGTGGTGGEAGEPLGDGLYDPDEVYLWGTLQEGACDRGGIASVFTPNVVATGFYCSGSGGVTYDYLSSFIHPTKNRLTFLYGPDQVKTQIAFFHQDATGLDPYPARPQDNDEMLTLPCVYPQAHAWGIYIAPDTGDMVGACGGLASCSIGECTYYRESGEQFVVPANYYLLALGYEGSAILGQGTSLVLRNPAGDLFPLDATTPTSIRAHVSGFWILKSSTTGTSPERWNVGFDGTLSRDGQYPEPPVSTSYAFPTSTGDFSPCKIDGKGRLFCFAESTLDHLVDQITRATLGANRAEVVYTEAANPLVRIHISHLVTGP